MVGIVQMNWQDLLAITLAAPDPRLEDLLSARDGVSAIRIETRTGHCLITGGAAARFELLKSLLDAGLRVIDFRVEEERLRDTYMATLGGGSE